MGEPSPPFTIAARLDHNLPKVGRLVSGCFSLPPSSAKAIDCMKGKFGVFPPSEGTFRSLYSVTLDQSQDSLKPPCTLKALLSPWVNLGKCVYLKISPEKGTETYAHIDTKEQRREPAAAPCVDSLPKDCGPH